MQRTCIVCQFQTSSETSRTGSLTPTLTQQLSSVPQLAHLKIGTLSSYLTWVAPHTAQPQPVFHRENCMHPFSSCVSPFCNYSFGYNGLQTLPETLPSRDFQRSQWLHIQLFHKGISFLWKVSFECSWVCRHELPCQARSWSVSEVFTLIL